MGKIIAVANQKGGVAKTTTAKNMVGGLVKAGKKVLAVDLDDSAGLTKAFGIAPDKETGTICDVFEKGLLGEDCPTNLGIYRHKEGIDILAGSNELLDYEPRLISAYQREVILRNFIYPLKEKYDYIFLDCPGSLGIITINALFAADAVIIPVAAQFLSVEAMQNLFITIAKVRKYNGTKTKPEIAGILFTMVRTNVRNGKKIMEELYKSYGENLPFFKTVITLSEKLSEADMARESIFSYAPNSHSAMQHQDLVNEFLELEDK